MTDAIPGAFRSLEGHMRPRPVQVRLYAGAPCPGILLEWRRTPAGGWEGLVVFATGGGPTAWQLSMKWVDAGNLDPT